jgi:hypothetical protein
MKMIRRIMSLAMSCGTCRTHAALQVWHFREPHSFAVRTRIASVYLEHCMSEGWTGSFMFSRSALHQRGQPVRVYSRSWSRSSAFSSWIMP